MEQDPIRQEDESWMRLALALAEQAFSEEEVPVGAVVVRDGAVLGSGYNRREQRGDPLAHAEMEAIREASQRLGGWRLDGCTLYVTLEPCPMCAGALLQCRMERVVFGARDCKAGCAGTLYQLLRDGRFNHTCAVTDGVLEEACSSILSRFFEKRRNSGRQPE